MTPRAILFDLDGTLADTAPDLAGALNRLLAECGGAPVPRALARPLTSSGTRGMLRVGFGIGPEHPDYAGLRARFLAYYEQAICRETRLFDGVADLLAALEQHRTPWGIVTNKPERLAVSLLDALHLSARAACIVGGDTTERPKPHPDPLLHAARVIRVPPNQCLYVGDDLRDVQAARAAGMPVIAAGYGYLGEDGDPTIWSADGVIFHPSEVLNFLERTSRVG
jgi:2-phosphoglycolate phosphatase